jgi:hypothetical protein
MRLNPLTRLGFGLLAVELFDRVMFNDFSMLALFVVVGTLVVLARAVVVVGVVVVLRRIMLMAGRGVLVVGVVVVLRRIMLMVGRLVVLARVVVVVGVVVVLRRIMSMTGRGVVVVGVVVLRRIMLMVGRGVLVLDDRVVPDGAMAVLLASGVVKFLPSASLVEGATIESSALKSGFSSTATDVSSTSVALCKPATRPFPILCTCVLSDFPMMVSSSRSAVDSSHVQLHSFDVQSAHLHSKNLKNCNIILFVGQ